MYSSKRRFADRARLKDGGPVALNPPAEEMKQIMSIAAKRGDGDAADALAIEEAIDPRNFPSGCVHNAERTLGIVDGG